jgi:hypothetical protein
MFSDDPPQPVMTEKKVSSPAKITGRHPLCLKKPASTLQLLIPRLGSVRSVIR